MPKVSTGHFQEKSLSDNSTSEMLDHGDWAATVETFGVASRGRLPDLFIQWGRVSYVGENLRVLEASDGELIYDWSVPVWTPAARSHWELERILRDMGCEWLRTEDWGRGWCARAFSMSGARYWPVAICRQHGPYDHDEICFKCNNEVEKSEG